MKEFFGNIGAELKRIAWPTDKEMKQHSTQVFLFMIILSLFFFGIDAIISGGMALATPDAPTFIPPFAEDFDFEDFDFDFEDFDFDFDSYENNGEEDEGAAE